MNFSIMTMQNYYNYKTHDNYRPTRMNQTKEIIKKLKTKTWYIRVKSRNSKIQKFNLEVRQYPQNPIFMLKFSQFSQNQ